MYMYIRDDLYLTAFQNKIAVVHIHIYLLL